LKVKLLFSSAIRGHPFNKPSSDRPVLTKDDKKKWMSSEAGDKNGCPFLI